VANIFAATGILIFIAFAPSTLCQVPTAQHFMLFHLDRGWRRRRIAVCWNPRSQSWTYGAPLRRGISGCAFCAHKVFQRLGAVDLRAKPQTGGYDLAVAGEG
jgi:hypothetical protein